MDSFRFDGKCLSQLPALQVQVSLGYQCLTGTEALTGQWRLPIAPIAPIAQEAAEA